MFGRYTGLKESDVCAGAVARLKSRNSYHNNEFINSIYNLTLSNSSQFEDKLLRMKEHELKNTLNPLYVHEIITVKDFLTNNTLKQTCDKIINERINFLMNILFYANCCAYNAFSNYVKHKLKYDLSYNESQITEKLKMRTYSYNGTELLTLFLNEYNYPLSIRFENVMIAEDEVELSDFEKSITSHKHLIRIKKIEKVDGELKYHYSVQQPVVKSGGERNAN